MTGLQQLSVGEQVGLLFVALFGLLAITSIVVFGRSLADAEGRRATMLVRVRRDLRAVWVGAVLFWVAWASGALVSTLLFGLLSFLVLRELITLTHTVRADHRALLLAFFVVLPVQYLLVGTRHFDLFTVFIPVYVFLAIPVLSALGNEPRRFLERAAKIQWGVMVCIYGMSHAPALLLLDLPGYAERGAFLVMFLVLVVAGAHIAQEVASRALRRRPVARAIDRSFSWRAGGVGVVVAAAIGAGLYWITPFAAIVAAALGAVAGLAGNLGALIVKALKRDAGVRPPGRTGAVTGAVGLLDRVAPVCFAAPVFFHSVRWYAGTQG